ncbi:MAG: ATP-binding cassette domain-containing protein [Flavobacteriaceae bacterium]|nr:ATP-binding cassette domain-containing protein [Flavobacteriaceae bacterium]
MSNLKKLTPLKRFIKLLKIDKKDIFQVLKYAVFAGLLDLSLPLGIQSIINLIQGAQVSTSWVVLIFLVTLGVAFVGVLKLMQMRIIETLQQKIFVRSAFEFVFRFPKIKMNQYRNQYPPELANRFFDTMNVQKGLSKILIDVPAALLQIIFALILLSLYHPFFIAFGFMLLILIYIVFKLTAIRGMETSLLESKYKYKVAHWIQEVARAVVSFKLSGNTKLAIDKNDDFVEEYLKARESHFKILVIQFIQMIGFKVLVTASLLIIGGLLVLKQEMNIGQFVAAEIIIILIINSVEKLILGLETFYDVLTSIEKLGQVMDKELENQNGEIPYFGNDFVLEINNISYKATNKDKSILTNISLKVNSKSRIFITGESGSGKSTLLNLISGIIQPTLGAIYLNHISLENINLNLYRSNLGLSLANESVFEGTIKQNITFGDTSISEERLLWAINKVELSKFIKESKDGLNTILFSEGKQTSYTNIKKIVLARAIVSMPKILILEDPLEYFEKSEADRIINFLSDTSNPWALIVVSHNDSWKNNCSQLVTLKNGSIL